jgi:hypothetical protein
VPADARAPGSNDNGIIEVKETPMHQRVRAQVEREHKNIAEEIVSLAESLRDAPAPYDVRFIVAQLQSKVGTLASGLPGPVATCELDGSGVYEAQGAEGPYRYCIYGHRWPPGVRGEGERE